MVKALHRRGHRGDPRRRLQPHRRGQPPRADAVVQGRRQPALLPARARRPAPLHGLHGHGQHARRARAERPAADHGLAALLGHRVPRRRLPLRPRVARSRASSTTSTGSARSSTSSTRTRSSRRSSSSPSRGTSGPGGYQVGNFPVLWTEWNGMYRDVVRDFWRGQAPVAEFAARFTGSSDLYEDDGRTPFASVNFVTAHDGFTLRDLVSYNEKHNEANLEDNRDGTDDNRSWNCGVEGETDDHDVLHAARPPAAQLPRDAVPVDGHADAARRRRDRAARRAATTTRGARTTRSRGSTGSLPDQHEDILGFTRRLIALRREHPVFRRTRFLRGEEVEESGLPDVWWFRPDGRRMTTRGLGAPRRARARRVPQRRRAAASARSTASTSADDSFLLLFNAHHEDVEFELPGDEVRQALGGRADDGRPRGAPARQRAGRRRAGRGHVAVAAAAASGSRERALPLHVPAAARAGPRVRRGARARAVPRRRSASRTCTCRRRSRRGPGSTHGYDVVDPTSISAELGGEEAFRALVAAAREAGLGVILDIVPNHMAVDDANRYWTDAALRASSSTSIRRRPASTGASSTSTTSPACGRRTRRSSRRRTGSRWRSSARGSSTGCGSTTPTGMADPAGTSAAARRGRRARLGREDPRPRRAAARLAGRGDGRLRVPQRRAGAVRRPGRRGGADVARPARRSASSRSRRSSSRRRRRSRARSTGSNRIRPVADTAELLASLPVYRTYDGGRVGRGPRGARARGPARTSTRASRRSGSRASSRRRRRSWPRASRTPRSTATSGCWRSTTSAATRRGSASRSTQFHAGQPRARRALPAQPAHHPDARHEALGRRARADRRAVAVRRRVRRAGAVVAAADGPPDELEQLFVFQTMLGAHPISEERVRGYFEKAMREAKRNSNWIEPDEDVRARASRTSRLEVPSFPGFAAFAEKVAEAGHRSAMAQTLLKLTVPGRARHLPGRRARHALARRPRQPPRGRLGPPPRAARAQRRPDGRRATRRSSRSIVEALALRARAAGGVRGLLRAARRRAGRLRVRARRRRCWSSPSCATPGLDAIIAVPWDRPRRVRRPHRRPLVRAARPIASPPAVAARVLILSWEYPPIVEGGLAPPRPQADRAPRGRRHRGPRPHARRRPRARRGGAPRRHRPPRARAELPARRPRRVPRLGPPDERRHARRGRRAAPSASTSTSSTRTTGSSRSRPSGSRGGCACRGS